MKALNVLNKIQGYCISNQYLIDWNNENMENPTPNEDLPQP